MNVISLKKDAITFFDVLTEIELNSILEEIHELPPPPPFKLYH